MSQFLTNLLISFYRLLTKLRIYWIARRYGYKITNFEWLPNDEDDDRIVRVTPQDTFEHQRDNCPCEPNKTLETDDSGRDYMLIQHKRMS